MATFDIDVPAEWDILVKEGSKINLLTSLAQISVPTIYPQTIPLAKIVGFNPSQIFKHIKKGVGSVIRKGEVIAQSKSLFSSKTYVADADGMITHIDHVTGEIVYEQVQPDTSASGIMSMAEGTIAGIKPSKLTVKVTKTLEIELEQPIADRLGGRVVLPVSGSMMVLKQEDIASNIVVADSLDDYSISKCEALQALAFVTPTHIPSHITTYTLKKPQTYADIVDFAPAYVYANPSETRLTFYK
ncbi:MAG: hypothetical protein WCJ70_01895 [bacterium]